MARFVTHTHTHTHTHRERECVRVIANLSPWYNQDVEFYKEQFWRMTSGFLVFPSKPLFIPKRVYISLKGTYAELKCFIKQFTRLETSSTFLNNQLKILQKILIQNFPLFTYKIPEFEFSLYEKIFSKPKHHYYNLSLYIPIYTTKLQL